jgi:hypothetical protein
MRAANLNLNPEKCVFGIHKGKVLGCLVSTKGIEANPDKIRALVEMQDPVSVKDVQKLTGRVVSLNRFFPRAPKRSLPFFQVLRSAKNFQWSEPQKRAFQELKDYLSNMTKLCPPELKSPLLLYVSASNSAVSAVLVQEKEEEGKLKQIHVYFVWLQNLLLRTGKNRVCNHHGSKEAKALFRGSQDKSHHQPAAERFVRK